jgi:CRP-like cAMP-binding protein
MSDRFDLRNSGNVSVEKDGKKVDSSGPGAFFGETALVHDITRTASVIAAEECQLAVLSRDAFLNFKNEYKELAQQIQKIADDRFEAFKKTLASLDVGDPASFSEEQVNHFRQVFQDIDADKSGTIDIDGTFTVLGR